MQRPSFSHPKADSPFIRILENVPDPRGISPNLTHSLSSTLFIVMVSMLCGAEDWDDMNFIGEQLKPWIAKYVDISAEIPSARTFKRVISSINPSALESMLRETIRLVLKPTEQDVIAIDGKSLCGSKDKAKGRKAVHLLHAWSCENRLCLAQKKVEDKSNEITAMCGILDQLFLKGNIVTADAIHTQKNTVKKIVEKEAHYVLPVKKNQPSLLESIDLLMKEAEQVKFQGIDADEFESLEKVRGRVEQRICTVIDASELVEAKEWKNLRTVAKIVRRRTTNQKTKEEQVYYISDLDLDAEKIAKAAREHWGVENGLHYALDVVLKEDSHIYRDRNGACNLSAIRKIILAALQKTETKKKRSKKTKRLLAAMDPDFRSACLEKIF